MCSARFTHCPATTRLGGSGTWQCSGVALTSLNELLKNSRRRVDSASEMPTSNEMCCPVGT
jgi:hypothetical protein